MVDEVTVKLPGGEQMSIYEASRQYAGEGTPLIVLNGVSHFAPLQRPEQFNDAILGFLQKTSVLGSTG